MRRTILLTTVMLLATLAVPAVAATYGTPDGDDHPYVVLLTFYYSVDDPTVDTDPVWVPDSDPEDDVDDSHWDYPVDYQWRCTGTILDADTILTAGHCVHGTPYDSEGEPADSPATMALAHVYIGYNSTEVHPAKTFPMTETVESPARDEALFVTGTPVKNAGYNDAWTDFPQTYDYGVVHLDEPLVDDQFVNLDDLPSLATIGKLDTYSQRELRGLVFETVGYGLQYTRGPWRFQGDWVRYKAESTLINTRSANNGGFSFQTTNNKGRYEGGSCFGDSGGPVFLQDGDNHPRIGEHVIIGIVSWGYSPNCTGADWSYRADRDEVHDFVAGYLD